MYQSMKFPAYPEIKKKRRYCILSICQCLYLLILVILIKKHVEQQQISKKFPFLEPGKSSHLALRKTALRIQEPGINLMERDERRDLKALQLYKVAPIDGSTNPNVKVSSSPDPERPNIIPPEVSKIDDLIDFSDVDLLSVDDLGQWSINPFVTRIFY